jgi:parvulin-like peptidyl-prolyl isomerase
MTIEEFKDILVKNGTMLDDYKKEIKQHLTKIKLISREIRPKIAVSDKEIGDYYSKHRDDYEGKETNRIKQILIVVPEDCDEETKEKLREKAEMVLEKLKEGEPFDLMASRYSQGPAAEAGGDLGFVEINAMFPAVDKVAFELEKGEISDVIESPIGFHIIMVADKRGTGIKPIEEVKEEIKDMIANKKTEGKFQQWIEDLRKKSLIEILLYE